MCLAKVSKPRLEPTEVCGFNSEDLHCFRKMYVLPPPLFSLPLCVIRDISPLYKPSSVVRHYNRSGPEPVSSAGWPGRCHCRDDSRYERSDEMRSDSIRPGLFAVPDTSGRSVTFYRAFTIPS